MNSTFNYGSGHLTAGICLDITNGKTNGIIDSTATKRFVIRGLQWKR